MSNVLEASFSLFSKEHSKKMLCGGLLKQMKSKDF